MRTRKYDYYFHPEIKTFHEFAKFAEDNPEIDCYGLDNADYVMAELSKEEQKSSWIQCINNIENNTRFILDRLESLPEFQVDWNSYNYRYKKGPTIGKPKV